MAMPVFEFHVERIFSGTFLVEAETRNFAEDDAKGILDSMSSTDFNHEPENDVDCLGQVTTWPREEPVWRGGESGGWDLMSPDEGSQS